MAEIKTEKRGEKYYIEVPVGNEPATIDPLPKKQQTIEMIVDVELGTPYNKVSISKPQQTHGSIRGFTFQSSHPDMLDAIGRGLQIAAQIARDTK